jgi:dephospho-CoA kinase
MSPGGDAYEAVMAAFGTVDRAALAARVFSDPAELAKLNAIVHPTVRKLALKRLAEADAKVGIYVAAILLESGAYRDVGKIIVVTCSREQQIARAVARGGKEADVLARLSRQMPLDEKKARADYVIDASGTEEETLRQTKLVWEDLIRQA